MYEQMPGETQYGVELATVVVQTVPAPHWPFEPHVSTLLPEHCVAPGVQTPVHAPPLQR
jgi:hypothetical protein